MPERRDFKETIRGPVAGDAPRRSALPPKPPISSDVRGYRVRDVAEEPLQAPQRIQARMDMDGLEGKSRLSPDVFAALGAPNAKLIKYIRTVIDSYPAPPKEDDRIGGRVKTESGQPAAKGCIAGSIAFVRNFLQSATFAGEFGEERLEALLLYCGGELNRLFLLTNAPLPRLGDIDLDFYGQLTAARSIKLSAPGRKDRRDIYIFLAPLGIERTLMGICRKNPATDFVLTRVGELKPLSGDSSPSGVDLPAVSARQPREPEFLRGTSPFPERAEDAASGLHNSLEIKPGVKLKPEDLRGMRKVDNHKAVELFGGYEVVLTRPGVEGVRLIATPRHPNDLVNIGAEQIGYIDPTAYMEVVDRKGRALYYIKVREGHTDFTAGSLDNTARILDGRPEEPKPVPEPAREDAPASERRTSEAHDAVREYVARFPGAKWGPDDEVAFGGGGRHIAVLFSSGGKSYLVTDGDWDEAHRRMEEHLYANGRAVRLMEALSGSGRPTASLPSGGQITLTVKSVRKAGENGEPTPHTLPMIPRHVLAAAGVPAPKKEDSEAAAMRKNTVELIRGAELCLTAGEGLDGLDGLADVFMEPDSIEEVKPAEKRWYLIMKTSEGKEYALFRFKCGLEDLNPELTSMSAAAVFTNRAHPGFSFVLIDAKFLTPVLIEWLLGNWRT
ncbi:MAG: hypothetical protein AB1657_04155 [Candidatus Micrarchaeota archaeon]